MVILVNEHSASAVEMVAAFASENGLATLVGTRTAEIGRIECVKGWRGLRVVVPVAAFSRWAGTNLEGQGVKPTQHAPLSLKRLRGG